MKALRPGKAREVGRDQTTPASWALGKGARKLQEGIEEVGSGAGKPSRRLVHRHRGLRDDGAHGREDRLDPRCEGLWGWTTWPELDMPGREQK